MLRFSQLALLAHDLSSWAVRNPRLVQALSLALALSVALAAALVHPGTALACPACGGGGNGG